jgi:hypothetical protein
MLALHCSCRLPLALRACGTDVKAFRDDSAPECAQEARLHARDAMLQQGSDLYDSVSKGRASF